MAPKATPAVYYSQLTDLENWLKQYIGARMTYTGRKVGAGDDCEQVTGVLSLNAAGKTMITDDDGDSFKCPKVG